MSVPCALPHYVPARKPAAFLSLGAGFPLLEGFQSKTCFVHNQHAKKEIQADKLPPMFRPEAETIIAKPAACFSRHSKAIVVVYSIFSFMEYVRKINNNLNWTSPDKHSVEPLARNPILPIAKENLAILQLV